MDQLQAKVRSNVGGSSASKLRKCGQIPIALHKKDQCIHLSIDQKAFYKLAKENSLKTKLEIIYGGESVPVIMNEIQYSPITYEPLHIDFQYLDQNAAVKVHIPIVLDNITNAGDSLTYLQHQLTELTVECLPAYIPSMIKADGSGIQLGHPLTVGDLAIIENKNIKICNEKDEVIALLARIGTNLSPDSEEESADEIATAPASERKTS